MCWHCVSHSSRTAHHTSEIPKKIPKTKAIPITLGCGMPRDLAMRCPLARSLPDRGKPHDAERQIWTTRVDTGASDASTGHLSFQVSFYARVGGKHPGRSSKLNPRVPRPRRGHLALGTTPPIKSQSQSGGVRALATPGGEGGGSAAGGS